MAIVLKYGSPGPFLAAGYAAGVGHRKNAQQEDLLKIWQQQTQQGFQAQQANLHFQQTAALQQQAQNFQAKQAEVNRDSQYWQTKYHYDSLAEQNRLHRNAQTVAAQAARFGHAGERELDRQQQVLLQKSHEEAIRDQDTMEGLRRGQLELPEAAKRKLEQLNAGLVDAMELDPTQQQEFRDKYEKQKRELLRTAQPRTQLSPEEQFNQTTFEKDGTLYQRTDKGLDVLKDSTKQTEKAHADAAKYSSTLHAEAVRMQKADAGVDDKMKPLDAYMEEAKKGLAAAGITAPQPATQPAQQQFQPGINQNAYEKFQADMAATPPQQAPGTQPVSAASAKAPEATADQDEASKAFDAKWATLDPGQSLRGPDGRIYIKTKAQ